ncbi:MAG: carboxypeptidase-like regulatory domain-containing protein [Labilibaculum sp.]|nr:carboxypeptidase-like regulatory domain-containing protein [Labilibaculum sp.]MBI9058590.1 carboxypeptidase-like regulatory domain-containing protein [Labilibaculum sp.]
MKTKKEHIQYICNTLLKSMLIVSICLTSFHLSAQENLLQNKTTVRFSELSLTDALDTLAAKNNCYFTYNSNLFSKEKKVSLEEIDTPLNIILRKLIPDTSLNFQLVNKHIIIVPNNYKKSKALTTDLIPYLSYRKISGKITDQNSKTGLPYASLGLRGKHVGTITNQDGDFTLTLSSNNIHDTLVVSYVGYKNTEIPVSEITENKIHIKLKEDFISLQEVIIRNKEPKSLIRAAINKIEKNYPQKPTNITSFYRESVLKNNKYMIYLESILEIYKPSYDRIDHKDKVKIFKSRKIYDVSRLDTISFRLKGGIQGCLFLDIIKHTPEFLDPEYMHFYNYHLSDISSFDNKPVYVIEFRPKPNLSTPLMEGKIIIATRSLAIISAEFGYNPDRLHEITRQFISKGNAKTKVKALHVDYAVNYRQIDGKYYLNHSLGNLKFKVRNRKKLFSQSFSTSFEMATTKLDTTNIRRYKFRETISPETIMSTENLTYDQNFWGNQTFIKPEKNIKEAIKRISSSMQQVAMDTQEEE